MAKERLIELLNQALQTEYTDVFLYPRQADLIKEKEISELFENFGRMELRHADNLAMQIIALGNTPSWEFNILDINQPLNQMLQGHLDRENKCLEMYNQLIKFCEEEKEDQLKLIIKGIKSEEQDHFNTIKKIINEKKQDH